MSRLTSIIDNSLHYMVIITLSLMFFVISFQANDIQKQLSQQSNYFFDFFYTANNLIAFSIPIFAFVFFFITTKIMLFMFDIHLENRIFSTIIGNSFIGLFFTILFYSINIFLCSENIHVNSIADVQNINFLFGLTFKDFEQINTIGWLSIYLLMICQIHKTNRTNIYKSIIVVLTPSLIVFLIKRVFLNLL